MKTPFILAIAVLLFAIQVSAGFDKYVGLTEWDVKVIEDETGCGGSREESTHKVSLQHNFQIVDVGDLGHGPTRGEFKGNIIHVNSRKIRDGKGYSTLTAFDIVFDENCRGFDAKYYWDYQDSYSSCSGYTEWHGTKTSPPPGCPSVGSRTNIIDARSDSLISNKIRKLDEILTKDPANFWANWDMAEIRKKQGDGAAYFKHLDKALDNEKIYQKTREDMKQTALDRLHLTERPNKDTSPILRLEEKDINEWKGGVVGAITIPPNAVPSGKKKGFSLWTLLEPDSYDIINNIIGLPEE